MKKRDLAHHLRKQLLSNLADMICADMESNVSSVMDSTDDEIIEMLSVCPKCGAPPRASTIESVTRTARSGDEFQIIIDGVNSQCECTKHSAAPPDSPEDDLPF